MRARVIILGCVSVFALAACGVKEQLEQRIQEEVAEKIVEVAAGGEIDIEKQGDKVTVVGKNGEKIVVDGQQGTVHVVDEQGKATNYEHAADGSAKVTNSEGLEATTGKELPSDFPLALPPVKEMEVVNRVVEADGSKVFTANFKADSSDLEAMAAQMQATFEAKGLTVERTKWEGPDSAMITVVGKQADGKLEASAMLSTSKDSPNVVVALGWSDKTAVAP